MASSTLNSLRIASHNIQGMNSPLKRRKIFNLYKSLNLDAIMLQETHFLIRYSSTFLHAHFPQFYLAKAENKTKGVAIAFSKNCKLSWSLETKEPESRFFLVKGTIEGQLYSLVSYYAPNKGQSAFFARLFDTLNPLLEGI